jgi:hypothetical protein
MQDPADIDLNEKPGRDLLAFQNTCGFLTALCRTLVVDISKRCSTGVSCHTYGSLALLNLIEQK